MDYVIAGLALGSVLAIAGFVLREAGMSRRISLPSWMANFGLVLMATAVVAWVMTFTAIVTDQSDSTSQILLAAGSLTTFVVGLIYALRLKTLGRSSSHPETAGNARTAVVEVAEPEPAELLESESQSDPDETVAPEEPAAAVRERQDWEAIWRETWGSGELPRSISALDAQEQSQPDGNDSQLTWSDSPDSIEDEGDGSNTDEPEPILANVHREESSRDEATEDSPGNTMRD